MLEVPVSKIHRIFGEFLLEVALFEAEQLQQKQDSLLAIAALLLVSMRISLFEQTDQHKKVVDNVLNFIKTKGSWYALEEVELRAQ